MLVRLCKKYWDFCCWGPCIIGTADTAVAMPLTKANGTYVSLQPIEDIIWNEAHDCKFISYNTWEIRSANLESHLERW
ncbi:hypothetical protein TNCV_48311 [Trichonephila clavipes]|nr:hypothetical protein TNCV_48311 [Trichonephila clavipes]